MREGNVAAQVAEVRRLTPPRAAKRAKLQGVNQTAEPAARRLTSDYFEDRVARCGLLPIAAQDEALNVTEFERCLHGRFRACGAQVSRRNQPLRPMAEGGWCKPQRIQVLLLSAAMP